MHNWSNIGRLRHNKGKRHTTGAALAVAWCLSVTSRSSIETAERIERAFSKHVGGLMCFLRHFVHYCKDIRVRPMGHHRFDSVAYIQTDSPENSIIPQKESAVCDCLVFVASRIVTSSLTESNGRLPTACFGNWT